MNIPSKKNIIEDFNSIIDMEKVDFENVLSGYINYIDTLSENREFREIIGGAGCEFLKQNIEILKINLQGKLSSKLLKEKKANLWHLIDISNSDSKKIVKLIVNGLTNKENMLDYSNYPEYLSEDMLEISISTLYDLDWKYANDFCFYLKQILKDK
jgi:hypothetical protein